MHTMRLIPVLTGVLSIHLIFASQGAAAASQGKPDVYTSNRGNSEKLASITVTFPNGGENLPVGSIETVTWTSVDVSGNVRIEYSTNGGGLWRTIVESTENDGSYDWTIPAQPSTECLVRISETDVDGDPSDVSDAVFSIVSPVSGSITVRYPNGGEIFETGSTQVISWTSTGNIENVTISYSTDSGATWRLIAHTATNNGSYDWVVPNGGSVSDQCLVRVGAQSSDLDPVPSDRSDAVFSIVLSASQLIEVYAPNGGEQLPVGSSYTIAWMAVGSREDLRIEYSTDAGGAWTEITAAAENTGKFDWRVPDTPSDNCLIRISESDGQPMDTSDELFSIVAPSQGDITVVAPNGGESWSVGSSQQIAWTASGDINYVMVEYSIDYGITWRTVAQSIPNDGGFDWTMPKTVSDECLVRVSSNDASVDPRPSDVSNAVFSIVLASLQPAITVVAPNGGEQLIEGSRWKISWDAVSFRGDLKIEYSYDAGQSWIVIVESFDGNGDYEWLVPYTPSDSCLVRVSATGGQPVDVSDAIFSIVSPIPDDITVTAPNGGEAWTVGSSQEVTWSPIGTFNFVVIDYSTDDGITWRTIVQSTIDDGSHNWIIPASVSDGCLVRVAANDSDLDPQPSDTSDGAFSIVPDVTGELRVTSPNGGEEWEVGSNRPISWISSGSAGNVTIEYSTDIGITWSTIAAFASNTGTFSWLIPYTVSHDCLVRVSAHDGRGDPKPTDVSDEVFSLVRPSSPTIKVVAPNGGEDLVVGSRYPVTWFGTNSRGDVQIDYSTDSGSTWKEIAGTTENDGDHDWVVPNEPSQTCLVRINDIDGQPVDISDAVFAIGEPPSSTLTVTAPNGGEELVAGSDFEITWTSEGLDNVIIEYSLGSKGAWIFVGQVPATNGSHTWTVPGTPSEGCRVRISGTASDETPWDVSDEVFTITDLTQAFIEVLTPNGGESLGIGEEFYVTWASSGVNTVLIEYSTDNGGQWIPIDTVAALGGRFSWTIPNTPTDTCLIRASSVPVGSPADASDAVFSIE